MKKTINGVEYTTFEENKRISELGIDTTRKFIVVHRCQEYCLKEGDIVVLEEDDGSRVPLFRRISDGKTEWLYLGDLAYYDEQKTNNYYGIGIAEKIEELVKESEKYNKLNNTQLETKCSGGKKIMSIITNAFKSKENKALEFFNLGTTDNLNEDGRREFISYVYETGDTSKKGFLAKMVEAHKEAKKD